MSRKVNVPDPVHERLKKEIDERDIPMGAVVEEWMQSHDKLMRIQSDFIEEVNTRGHE